MGKTLILSQRQLDEVIGANSAYLDAAGSSDFRQYPGNEVSSEANLSDRDGVPTTTDKITDTMSDKNNSLWRIRTGGVNTGALTSINCGKESKKKLLESNSELEGRFFKIDPTTLKSLKKIYSESKSPDDAPGKITLKNIIDNSGMTYTDATSIKSRLDKLSPKSGEYNELGGRALHRFLNMTLANATDIVKRDKENKVNMGFDNVYQKPGGTKNSGNGKAHTPNKGNIIPR